MNSPVEFRDEVELVIDLKSDLGEGPLWHSPTSTLVFVDTNKGIIHRFDPATSALASMDVGVEIGAAIPRRRGGFVASSTDGLMAVNETTRSVELLVSIEGDLPSNRMNDAKCDSRGRLWSGTFSKKFERKVGSLYRIDTDLTVTRVTSGVTISNGIGWNSDETKMYYVDTAARGVDVFDYDIGTGTATNKRRFVDISRDFGMPDGITVDAEDCVWVALYYGGAVRRYSPQGEWLATVSLPVSRVTSCGFGGSNLDELYITTANQMVDGEGRQHEKLSGGLFRCRVGVSGLPVFEFGG